ncbi:MAG: discoidin domain-containing protein [Gemmatimonadota bacterium]
MTRERAARALIAALALGGALAAGTSAETWVQDAWRRATYYRATFTAPRAGTGQLYIAAVDSYAVYLNGSPVGGDSTWTRMGVLPVRTVAGTNHLAAAVVNRGGGVGHGLLAHLEIDSLRIATTTDRSRLSWRWSGAVPVGTEWRTAVPGDGWEPVQNGDFDTTRIAGFAGAGAEIVAGYDGGVDAGGETTGVTLKRILGENLALDKPANRVETVDGDLQTAWEPPVASLNFTASVDLQERYLVRRVRVLTKGPGYADNSLRGYSVQVSDDQVRWTEVASLHDIADYVRTEVSFTPTWTRFVRIVVIQINAVTQPRVAEVEVYGDGYIERGALVSEPLALGAAGARKNLGRVEWAAQIPERTELTVQFRSGDSAADFADPDAGWSLPLTAGGIWYPASEPGRLVQYRVNMETRDERRSPLFQRLALAYSTTDLPLSAARAWVTPNQVPMGTDTTFTYALDLAFGAGDLGVERLQISVPSEAALDAAGVEGATGLASWSSTQDTLTLVFAAPLRTASSLRLPLRTRTFSNLHSFRAAAFSPGSDNPLNVLEDRQVDPVTGRARSWELLATTAAGRVLSQVRAAPPVLTPNGDGVNDDTVIEFVLAKVDVPRPVRIRIADLAGRAVADLGAGTLASGSYQRSGSASRGDRSPGWWDGRNAAGELVPPGLYLYRVEVGLDSGDEVGVGVVGVAY